MEHYFQRVNERVLRLDVPFEDLFTSVFFIEGETPIIIDAATTRADAENIVIPALEAIGFTRDRAGYMLVTHRHGDHSGGVKWLLSYFPHLQRRTLSDGEALEGVIAYAMSGHTEDSTGYYDAATKTLLTGDALQFFGVSKYGCSIVTVEGYERTLRELETRHMRYLLPSHAFAGGVSEATGDEAIGSAIRALRESWKDVKEFILEAATETREVAEIKRRFGERFPTMPPLPRVTVEAVLRSANRID